MQMQLKKISRMSFGSAASTFIFFSSKIDGGKLFGTSNQWFDITIYQNQRESFVREIRQFFSFLDKMKRYWDNIEMRIRNTQSNLI